MTDTELKKKLEQFVTLGNTLHAEAKRRYGEGGQLFHEADGDVLIMRDDPVGARTSERGSYIEFCSAASARWGQGAF